MKEVNGDTRLPGDMVISSFVGCPFPSVEALGKLKKSLL